jgi:nucleotidyltransferase/DNA polymerase involved in DNA repair
MPSYGEIMELVGFRSRHAVYRLMNRLMAKGLVIKDPQGKLIPTNSNGIAILGVVEAKLKGQPVITGKERGIASAVSYEAKALGIKCGMSIREIKQICPDIIHLPSDYETYSLFSQRMFAIVRRYTSEVEEYSIDECFTELTGLRRPLRMSYEAMAARIKQDLERELGLTFSIGLAPTKVVAKIASRWYKPAGLTISPAETSSCIWPRSPSMTCGV